MKLGVGLRCSYATRRIGCWAAWDGKAWRRADAVDQCYPGNMDGQDVGIELAGRGVKYNLAEHTRGAGRSSLTVDRFDYPDISGKSRQVIFTR